MESSMVSYAFNSAKEFHMLGNKLGGNVFNTCKNLCLKRRRKVNQIWKLFEPPHGKSNNPHWQKTKAQISCAVTAQLINAFVFATRIVQFLLYLHLKLQASSLLLWLYRPVCIRRDRKPKLLVFLYTGSFTVSVLGLTL